MFRPERKTIAVKLDVTDIIFSDLIEFKGLIETYLAEEVLRLR